MEKPHLESASHLLRHNHLRQCRERSRRRVCARRVFRRWGTTRRKATRTTTSSHTRRTHASRRQLRHKSAHLSDSLSVEKEQQRHWHQAECNEAQGRGCPLYAEVAVHVESCEVRQCCDPDRLLDCEGTYRTWGRQTQVVIVRTCSPQWPNSHA